MMKNNRVKYALYQGAVMCEVRRIMARDRQSVAYVVFDNREDAIVPCKDLVFRFDLTEGCAA